MNIVSITRLKEFWTNNSQAKIPLVYWINIVKKCKWKKWWEVKQNFPTADKVGDRVIFNIGGNNYRLIVIIRFFNNHVYVRWLGTHADYSKLTEREIKNL